MKALEYLKKERELKKHCADVVWGYYDAREVDKAIKELEAHIAVYQTIRNRLDNTVTTLAVLQNENKSLVTILEKYNEEMIELRKENEDLKERSK